MFESNFPSHSRMAELQFSRMMSACRCSWNISRNSPSPLKLRRKGWICQEDGKHDEEELAEFSFYSLQKKKKKVPFPFVTIFMMNPSQNINLKKNTGREVETGSPTSLLSSFRSDKNTKSCSVFLGKYIYSIVDFLHLTNNNSKFHLLAALVLIRVRLDSIDLASNCSFNQSVVEIKK